MPETPAKPLREEVAAAICLERCGAAGQQFPEGEGPAYTPIAMIGVDGTTREYDHGWEGYAALADTVIAICAARSNEL